MVSPPYIWLWFLVFASALVALLVGPERVYAELYTVWLAIKASTLSLYAWTREKVIIRFVRFSGQARITLLEARLRMAQRSIETQHRKAEHYRKKAEYNRASAEYWRTKARTTRRIRLLSARLAGEITEDEYRNLLAKDRRDLELARKCKHLAGDWLRGRITETEYRQQLEAINRDG